MKLNLSSALFLALVSGATAVTHETSTQAKVQPAQLITYRTVLKGVLPLQEKQVFVDMDDDKKTSNNDDKKTVNNDDKKSTDDDGKKNTDDDDKNSRNNSVPDCTTSGANYNRCDPATMNPSDAATCNSIKNGVCGSNMKSSDMDYCKCIGLGLNGMQSFRPVLKGTGSLKHKHVFMALEKDDDGGKTDDGNKNTDDGNKNTDDGNKNTDDGNKKTDDSPTDDKKTDDSPTDDKKTDDNATDDKKTDDGTDDKKNTDDDKNRKDDDDDDKKNKDDDDDKKNKDDDDDDNKSRNNNVPECITGGKNYLRCDPDTMNPSDAATCTSIKNEVCGAGMSSVDESYCECIGLVEQTVVTSLHVRTMLKGTAPLRQNQVFVDLDKNDDGGKTGGGNGANKSAGGNDDKKNVDTSDDKKNVNTDDDKKNVNTDDDKKNVNTDDDKKRKDDDDDDKKKNDDDDDKKNKDDDDDDKKNRNTNVPECVTGGKNYLRCNPSTMKSSDKATCNSIKQEVCGADMSSADKSYCECIGLDGKATALLRGAVSALF